MKYKCHYCGEILSNGYHYSLECFNCENCKIAFDKNGEITFYHFKFFEDGKDYVMSKLKGSSRVYLIDNTRFLKRKYLIDVISQLQIEDGMPQVYKLFEKLKKYILFS